MNWNWISGWKTYVAAAGFVLLAIAACANGDYMKGAESLGLALTAIGLRHAITTSKDEIKDHISDTAEATTQTSVGTTVESKQAIVAKIDEIPPIVVEKLEEKQNVGK